MKKLFPLLLFSFFIYPKFVTAQSPQVIKIVLEENIYGAIQKIKESNYHYNENRDSSMIEHIFYNDQGEVIDWIGNSCEYDSENRLSKYISQRYNQDVDLWISQDWIEYYYDNGCVYQSKFVVNSGGFTATRDYVNDNQCRPIEYKDSSHPNYLFTVEYPDNFGSSIIKIYRYVGGDEQWRFEFKIKEIFNRRGDYVEKSNLWLDFFGIDTVSFLGYFYDHNYIDSLSDGRILKKTQSIDRYVSTLPTTENHRYSVFKYQYNCDGTLKQTDESAIVYIPGPTEKKLIYTYFYEGKDECFDYDQNLKVSIFPNPSDGFINLESKIFESGYTQIQIFSVDGKCIGEQYIFSRNPSQSLNFSFLGNGIYFLKLKSEEYFSTVKMVIAK